MATNAEVTALITLMEEIYTHREKLSNGAVKLYQQALSDLDFEILEAAVKEHLVSSKWFPSIAELRERAVNLLLPEIPTSLEAWAEVQKEINRVGHLSKPEFENPLTARMVAAMGWRYLCLSDNGMVDRAHFLKGYDQLRDREAHGRVQLPGVKQLAEKLSQPQQLAEPQEPA